MRPITRLTVLAAAAVTGLIPAMAAIPAAAAPGPALAGGTRLWVAHYADGLHTPTYGTDVVTSPSGKVIFVDGLATRTLRGQPNQSATQTVAYAASTGALLWQARYNPGGNGTSEPDDMAVSPDSGTLFVTGDAGRLMTTVAYSS